MQFSGASPTLFSMNAQNPLIIMLFHGSRHQQAVPEATAFAARLSKAGKAVSIAFLQMATPLFKDVLADAVHSGQTWIQVFPLFTLTGAHVAQDIPEIVEQFRRDFPGLRIDLEPHLAADPSFEAWLGERINQKEKNSHHG